MRDKGLAYALAASVGVHLIILCIVGRTSAVHRVDANDTKYISVNVVKSVDEPKPAPVTMPESVVKPVTAPKQEPIPEQERIPAPTAAPKPMPNTRPQNVHQPSRPVTQTTRPSHPSRPTTVASNKLPGNPGGATNMGSTSSRGENLGGSGRTPVGWVPGSERGTGQGSGNGAGVGRPEPVRNADDGPGKEPAPAPQPPPPPADVDVKVCAESGMLPNSNCERTTVKSYRPGREPGSTCTECKPKHVSTLADRSVPEFVSGRKRPKYPSSAMDNGIEGSVTVEFTIDTDGNVTNIKVTSSSGNKDLDRAAISAVDNRKYKPAVQAGIPRNYRKRETFHFALD